MPARPSAVSLEADQQRKLAVELFNHTWTLLEKPDRSDRETELMIGAAHASRFFWEEAGDATNHCRGEWQLARVYAVAGRAEPAAHHARACLAIVEQAGLGGFDLAFAHEALARAHGVAGEAGAAAEHERQARAAATLIADAEDRDLVLGDLETL